MASLPVRLLPVALVAAVHAFFSRAGTFYTSPNAPALRRRQAPRSRSPPRARLHARVGNGDNCLDGSNGNDRLTVGTGNNMLSGGNGNDIFVFGPSFGKDTVADFEHGDRIEFDGGAFANFSAVQAARHQVGADTVISLGPDHAITLQHVNASSLHASDFLFG